MKFRRLFVSNLLRHKVRVVLTVGSFAVALFLFGVLAIVRAAFYQGVSVAGADRLLVLNRTSVIIPLPLAYKERMLRVPGVKAVTYARWFGGVYRDGRVFFPQFAIDTEGYRAMYPEQVVGDDEWRAFVEDREGCIVGENLARQLGWKTGDRIPLQGTIYPGNWEFNLRGIFHGARPEDDTMQFWLHWDLLDARAPQAGLVGWYVAKVARPDDAPAVARAIDETFANSSWETRTNAESAFVAAWTKQLGNVELLLVNVGGVVFFTLLLVTGNTMAMAVRERVRELAVLKAIGYSDAFVLGLVLAESLAVAAGGGALGLGLAKIASLGGDPTGVLGLIYLSPAACLAGFAFTLTVGALAGLIPALTAMRLNVVEALRRV